jgi:hypothetical protein
MDVRSQATPKTRARQTDAAGSAVPPGNTGGVVDGAQQATAAEPSKGEDGPRRPTVFGRDVDHLSLLMRQGEQAWLLAADGGNHEYANIRFMKPKSAPAAEGPRYIVKEGANRLGGVSLEHIEVDERGAWLSWTQGYRTHIPSDYFQLTWR